MISFGLGSAYPNGLFVAQDDQNLQDGAVINQNFKLVKWEAISKAFKKTFGDDPDIDNDVNPRNLVNRQDN